MPGGIVIIFGDWRRMPDLGEAACMTGLRPAAMVAWVRTRPGTGGLFRASWDPIMIAARGVPKAVDRAAIRNVVITEGDFGGEDFSAADLGMEDFSGEDVPAVVEADYERPRRHPCGKPPAVYEHILRRVSRPHDLISDPFAGSGASRTAAETLKLDWRGCDIDKTTQRRIDMTDMIKTYNDLPVHPWKEGIPAECSGCGVSAVRYGYVMAEQEDEWVAAACGAQAQPSCTDCGLSLAYLGGPLAEES